MKIRLYAIVADLGSQGPVLEGLYKSRTEALHHFGELKEEYKDVGIFQEFDDLLIFNNDDEFRIEETEIEIDC